MTTIDAIVKKLLIKKPFIGLFLMGMNRGFGDKTQTACVYKDGINIALCINEEFWNSLESDDMRMAVLEHEMSHVMFKHMFMQEFFADKKHFNIAADAEVNSYIPLLQNDPWIYAKRYNLENEKGTKYYYANIPKDDQSDEPGPDGPGGDGVLVDDHDSWSDFKDLSESEKQIMEKQIDYRTKQTAEQVQKMRGKIPGQFEEYVGSLFKQKPPVFNWKSYFRRMIGTIMDISLRKSRKKESLRFPDVSGIKHRKKTRIMVAIDTSGSVSNKELCDFFSEITHVHKAGAVVSIVEFDWGIEKQYEYTGKWDGNVHGRGGTSFEEPINLYNSVYKDYQALIIFTDGYAPIEDLHPKGNVVWVITSNGARQNYPGKTVYIPKNYE